ncbi:phytanoyl-CoA dioxygenase family protein [Actinoplanes sp. NPDC049316]|uniref:phytanoyl-CoA dioxygenase family protein n=1 Tax=Actinoplanes sp. NPDC049316 TaxID=3154727 RepID=UPI00341F83C0
MTTWLPAAGCRLADLRVLVEQTTDAAGYPLAAAVDHNVLIYDRTILAADRRAAAAELAEGNHVQLPLTKGDAAFFNPAVFHGAGTNRSTDVKRMANLPTDLDRDQPIGGLAPQTQAELMHQALAEQWDTSQFEKALHDQRERRHVGG